ncbi:MAG: metallophosphoesterase [candidate division Zixibacteria bacterium]
MNYNFALRTIAIICFLFTISLFPYYANAENNYDSLNSEVNINDGPYICWENDTTIMILYVSENNYVSSRRIVNDSITFKGLYYDSLTTYTIFNGLHKPPPETYRDVAKIFAVSDIHGEYFYLVELLRGAEIIDSLNHWIWGNGHLVINGDVFDRGEYVTECLWLIYNLEREANQQGGKVHFLLGNHELMILIDDNRYVNNKYKKGIVKKSRIRHQDLYGPDMEIGRWIRSKNTVIKINDILFVHGGLYPPLVDSGWTISAINRMARDFLELRSSQRAFHPRAMIMFGSLGPFWYRGFHYGKENRYPMVSNDEIDGILEFYGVNSVIVGHTHVDEITRLRNGKIYAIHIPLDELGYFQGLLWESGQFYKVNPKGERIRLTD